MTNQIGFLGPSGTFGELAAKLWLPMGTYKPFPTHLHILEAVEAGKIPQGVVAIENSVDGTVADVLDYFIHNADHLRICGEVVVPVNQCVFAKQGNFRPEDIRVIFSHPKGLGQCANHIHKAYPNTQQVGTDSTAGAVLKMLESDVPAIAIAGKTAMQNGTQLVAEHFEDSSNNSTRFWIVSREEAEPTGADKTSLVFETYKNAPGALLSVLMIFAAQGLNLCKVESRPTKEALGEYIFVVDVEAHQKDALMAGAFLQVKRCVPIMKILGSYPRWELAP